MRHHARVMDHTCGIMQEWWTIHAASCKSDGRGIRAFYVWHMIASKRNVFLCQQRFVHSPAKHFALVIVRIYLCYHPCSYSKIHITIHIMSLRQTAHNASIHPSNPPTQSHTRWPSICSGAPLCSWSARGNSPSLFACVCGCSRLYIGSMYACICTWCQCFCIGAFPQAKHIRVWSDRFYENHYCNKQAHVNTHTDHRVDIFGPSHKLLHPHRSIVRLTK